MENLPQNKEDVEKEEKKEEFRSYLIQNKKKIIFLGIVILLFLSVEAFQFLNEKEITPYNYEKQKIINEKYAADKQRWKRNKLIRKARKYSFNTIVIDKYGATDFKRINLNLKTKIVDMESKERFTTSKNMIVDCFIAKNKYYFVLKNRIFRIER